MPAEDVVIAGLRGLLEIVEVVCAPGVERRDLLDAVFLSRGASVIRLLDS